MYIAYAPPPPLSRPRQILFLGDAPLSRPTEKDTSTKRGCPLFFGGFSAPAHGLCGNVGRLPSQSRLPPCQLPQRGSQVCAPPKACAKPSLASPFGGRWCPVGTVQRLTEPAGESAPAGGGGGEVPAPLATNRSVAIHRNICYPRSAWDTMRESAKKRYKVGCLRSLRGWPFPGSLDFLFT